MSRDEIITRIGTVEPGLREAGVVGLYLFGSAVSQDGGRPNDIDIFVDVDEARFDFVALVRCKRRLETALGLPVDFGTRCGIAADLRADIEAEAVRVFG